MTIPFDFVFLEPYDQFISGLCHSLLLHKFYGLSIWILLTYYTLIASTTESFRTPYSNFFICLGHCIVLMYRTVTSRKANRLLFLLSQMFCSLRLQIIKLTEASSQNCPFLPHYLQYLLLEVSFCGL